MWSFDRAKPCIRVTRLPVAAAFPMAAGGQQKRNQGNGEEEQGGAAIIG